MSTYAVYYKLDIFPCKAIVKAHSKEEADAEFVRMYGEIPLSISLLDEDEEDESFQQL